MLSFFCPNLLMFSTISHVFDNFSCFCCHVFILRAGLRFPDGKLVLLPRRPNTNIPPEKLEIYFHKYRNMKSNANLQNRYRNVYFDKNIFQNLRNLTQFCFVSSGPQLQKVSWSRFCSHVFQFIFPPGIWYFSHFSHIYFMCRFRWRSIENLRILRASTLRAHIVPSRPSGRTGRVTQKRNLFRALPAPFLEGK